MLVEAIKYLSTPCAVHFKSMGYLHELIATESRYHRCRAAWRPHLERTKSVIKDAIDRASGRKKAVVLGAGILSDIPIHALSTHFETVELVDVCFLRSTRREVRQYRNLNLRSCDITGVASALHANPIVPHPQIPDTLELVDADLVVSANILSQLSVIPIIHLQKQDIDLSEESLKTFERELIQRHLDLLATTGGTVCLVTEIERAFLDGDRVIETEDVLSGVHIEINGDEWFWDLAPKGEASPDYAIRNRVIGGIWQSLV